MLGTMLALFSGMKMIVHRVTVLLLLFGIGMPAYALQAEDAVALGQAYEGEAMRSVVQSAAQTAIREALTAPSTMSAEEGGQPPLREKVEAELKRRVAEAMPGLVRDVVYDKLLRGAAPNATAQLDELIADVQMRVETSINAQLDPLVSQLYDRVMAELPAQTHLRDLRGTIDHFVSSAQIGRILERPLVESFGAATVQSVRGRIETALAGDLPPEVTQYLRQGPEAFSRFVDRVAFEMPGERWERLKSNVLDVELITLKNPIYGSMLAASALAHLAKAWCGTVLCRPWELKRSAEVGKVLLWQLQHREQITLNVRDLAALGPLMKKLPLPPMERWGKLGANMQAARSRLADYQERFDKFEETLHQFDERALKPLRTIEHMAHESVRQFEETLKDVQSTLLRPVRDAVAMTDVGMRGLANDMKDMLPERFNGVPASWEQAKHDWGVPGVLGAWGEQTPLEAIGQGDLPGKVQARAEAVRDAVAAASARVATATAERVGMLGLSARILGVERSPHPNAAPHALAKSVNLHNGELLHNDVDRDSAVLPLHRTYRSRHDFQGPLGRNWTHNYAEALLLSEDSAPTWYTADGRKIALLQSAPQEYHAVDDDRVMASWDAETARYRLKDADGHERIFSAQGRLLQREEGGERRSMLHYDAAQRLHMVDNGHGAHLEFMYDDVSRVSAVRDHAGKMWSYSYGEGDLLSHVAHGDVAKARTYYYQQDAPDDALRTNLTRIERANGQLVARYGYGQRALTYDRVISQAAPLQGGPLSIAYQLERAAWWQERPRTVLRTRVSQNGHEHSERTYGPQGQVLRDFTQVLVSEAH